MPRMWLHDCLFYAGFALLAWAMGEMLTLTMHWRQPFARRALAPLLATASVAALAWISAQTGGGLQMRVALSSQALEAAADAGYNDERRHAGLFLVDSTRQPCSGQTWLWLGRPYGAGTGTNLALVRSDASATIMTPAADAFAFLHLGDGWWMAYQHAARYQRHAPPEGAASTSPCAPGRVILHHREGLAFVAKGTR